jgi:hypothetical protein
MLNRVALLIWGLVLLSFSFAVAENRGVLQRSAETNLYKVEIGNQDEAGILSNLKADAVLRIPGGYLILADAQKAGDISSAGLACHLVADNVDRLTLALDFRHDRANVDRYPVVYQEGELRLFRIDPTRVSDVEESPGLISLPPKSLNIFYESPAAAAERLIPDRFNLDLDSLVNLISQDSLESYSYWLQAMHGRPSGNNQGAATILADRFADIGYDSIYIDDFWRLNYWGDHLYHGWNVVITKPGTVYNADQIIIGAHFDAVTGSPGADDNGSGVAAIMEIARILKDLETNLTVVFTLFDNEEAGLLGSHDYAEKAYERHDRIVFMLNMDMIAFYSNSVDAKLYHGEDTTYATLWSHLADSLPSIGISGHLSGPIINSDHYSFDQVGYPVVYAHEFVFSTVYHSYRDSTSYMDFDYFARMAKASLATAAYVDNTYQPRPTLLISCPQTPPTFFPPGATDSFKIAIEGYAGGVLNTSSAQMVGTINGGPPISVPLVNCGENIYCAPYPAFECGDRFEYYVIASELNSGTLYFYPWNNATFAALKASTVTTILDDNFETDKGWTVTGNASAGFWERYIASGNYAVPKYDYDHSSRCYLTDPSALSDVDNGTVSLVSPAFDIFPGDAYIEYARWFSNDLGASAREDIFKVYLYNGNQAHLVEVVGPIEQADGGWYHRSFWASDFIDPQLPVRLRFDACDNNYDSEVEAAVDAVKIIHYSYAPYILTETFPDELFGNPIDIQLEATSCHDPVTWSDKNGDLDVIGLTLSEDGHLSGLPSDTGIVSFTAQAQDANGAVSEKTCTFHVWQPFNCGDAGMDYQLNVGDAVYLINFVFKGGPAPYPLCVGDANGDQATNVGDAVYLINHIFKGGPAPLEGCCSEID